MNRRDARTERRIAAAFGLGALGAAAFAAAYVIGDQTQLLGGALLLAFAGLATGLAIWALRLLPQGPYVEEREPMISPEPERRALAAEFERDQAALTRAFLPRQMLTLAVGALGVAVLFPVRSLLFRGPDPWRALGRTPWREGVRVVKGDGAPVRPGDVAPGGMLTVFPEGHTESSDAAAVLIRVDPARLALPSGRAGWTVGGLVAYSKLCTHAGCPVGLYVKSTQQLMCPCHQSLFDVPRGAVPVAGPAARPLPQLPLGVGPDGVLVARGGFTAPVGPGYWRKA
ncbi:QcrA and Rieske domain-containing protein [Sphaerisporangium fuscum]|uniref:QcrA and Rieske domain-containing protein n=1 Tax=Sphaerisporangium fuscum TaxID=2835868 RepID=UPI001BDDA6C2|nr:Rieske 2Fe-2S domain-containing protein [Sphaerisporangium fuscum]